MRCVIYVLISIATSSALAQSSESDSTTYSALQNRIDALKTVRASAYHVAKAQCWLDASWHEATRNDRSRFPRAAREHASQLVDALEQRSSSLPIDTPQVGTERMRPDLWTAIAALQTGTGATCAAAKAACAEVKLVHAAHEYRQLGWRHARPYEEIAADWVAEAKQAASQCR